MLRLQLGEDPLQLFRRGVGSVGTLQRSQLRECHLLLLQRMVSDLSGEVLEDLPNLDESWLGLTMHGGDLAGQKVQSRQLVAQVLVMRLHDVIAQFRERHAGHVGGRRFGFVSGHGLQHRHHRHRVQTALATSLPERLLAAAAVVDAEFFKYLDSRRNRAHERTYRGFSGKSNHE